MAKPADLHIDVTLDSDNPLQFRVEPQGGFPTGPNGELIFQNNFHPGFKVVFHLKDPNGLGYRFPPHQKNDEGLWSELGNGACPTQGKWEVFKPQKVSEPDGMKLTALNPNPSPAQGPFGYTLRVTKDGGVTYLALDPGGVNQNGPQQQRVSPVLVFVAGAVVGSLATLGTQALLGA